MSRFTEVATVKIWHPTLQKFVTEEEFKALQTAVNLDKEIENAEVEWRKRRMEKAASGQPSAPSAKKGDEDMSSKKSNEKMAAAVKAKKEKMTPKKELKIITAIVKENPYRKGSKGEKKFNLILKAGSKGISVADYLKAGGQSSDIGWGREHEYLKVSE